MRVLLVCSHSFKAGQTGDATQGRETARALSEVGIDVVMVYVKYQPVRIFDNADKELGLREIIKIADTCDIIHLLPVSKPLCKFWRQLCKKPVAASSIFWSGLERICIAFMNNHGPLHRVKCALREMRNMLPVCMDYRGVDVFLPNSNAEGRCVMKCFWTDKNAFYEVVPNGFIPPDFNVWDLSRSELVANDDYVVVPGAFARRKNQIGLIKALRRYPRKYDVVFLGGALDEEYYNECISSATEKMKFLGYISSKNIEYWKILRHARVACLPSDCETPGIAMIEAAYAGARPVITKYGGTVEYYGDCGEYLNPCFAKSIVSALDEGWNRGRLEPQVASKFARFSWRLVAERTIAAYQVAISRFNKRT